VVFWSVVTGTLSVVREEIWSIECQNSCERSTTIISVTHSITICPEKLGKRDVSRPTCSCGWAATWAYVTEKFARDAGQQHITQILAHMQTVGG
jgi:hypothetical protein